MAVKDSNLYASHLPVLRRFHPRRVLEFGPGYYSTPHFLASPRLERLVSIEHDPRWFNKLRRKFADDRWELQLGKPYPDPKDFDLVLIDDGDSADHRVQTIRYVLGRKHPRVVIHDAEVEHYQRAIGDAPHVIYALSTPWTAVVS